MPISQAGWAPKTAKCLFVCNVISVGCLLISEVVVHLFAVNSTFSTPPPFLAVSNDSHRQTQTTHIQSTTVDRRKRNLQVYRETAGVQRNRPEITWLSWLISIDCSSFKTKKISFWGVPCVSHSQLHTSWSGHKADHRLLSQALFLQRKSRAILKSQWSCSAN